MIVLISILASFAAFAGGMIALRFKDKLHIILGLSAGTVIGAALFDLIPEAIELGTGIMEPGQFTALTAVGFLIYLILDRLFSFHSHGHNHLDEDYDGHSSSGSLGAASFFIHSLIDGVAIGLAFQASAAIGYIVAIAVIAHRFSDGINTIGVILRHQRKGAENDRALGWLTAVAVAPIIGTLSTFLFSVSDSTLAVILAIFAGFFLYIGASDLIPEGHHSHSKALTTIMTVVGALLLYIIVLVAHQ